MMRGERENFFSREKKPNVGFVILFPLSRHSLGDGGSLPFKKSGETFLFTFTYPYLEQSLTENQIFLQFLLADGFTTWKAYTCYYAVRISGSSHYGKSAIQS